MKKFIVVLSLFALFFVQFPFLFAQEADEGVPEDIPEEIVESGPEPEPVEDETVEEPPLEDVVEDESEDPEAEEDLEEEIIDEDEAVEENLSEDEIGEEEELPQEEPEEAVEQDEEGQEVEIPEETEEELEETEEVPAESPAEEGESEDPLGESEPEEPSDEQEGPVEAVQEEVISLPSIFINEVLPNPSEDDAANEWIELYNFGEDTVNMVGWRLDDARLDDGKEYIFSEDLYAEGLEPGGFLVLMRPESRITLNNDTDSLTLWDAEENIIDFIEFESPKSGRSFGRLAEDPGEWREFAEPSPGTENLDTNRSPVAVIDIQKDTRYMKLNVTGAGSFDPDGDKITYLWEFEEGVFNERENPLIYEYLTEGEKTVKLTVTDGYGKTGEAIITFDAAPKVVEVSGGGGGGGGVVTESSSEESLSSEVPVVSYPHLRLINEFMPNPAGKDTEGEWIELYNRGSQTYDLSGWYLDDAEGASRPYRIPDHTEIDPGSFIVFSEPDLKLSLKNSEDVVRLLNPNKEVSECVDYAEVIEDWSYARGENAEFFWTPLVTPYADNEFPPPPKAYQERAIVFKSVLPNPEGTDAENERILLKNLLFEDIELAGWSLEDGQGHQTQLQEGMLFAEGELELGNPEFRFSLNNSDETLFLFDPAGNLIDEISWKQSASGVWLFNPDSLQEGMQVEVIRVIDGDTFVISWEGRRLTVRLLGVDTPETVHPFKPVEFFGRQASDFLKNLLTGKLVRFDFEEEKIDKYGRLLAYVYLDELFVNEEIVRQGYGYAYTRFPFRFLDEFVAIEAEAKESKLGIWQNLKVRNLIESDALEAEDIWDEAMEEMLLMEEESEVLEEEILEESVEAESELEDELEDELEVTLPDCRSDFLKIESFFPNSEKGVSVEYIRLKNEGSEPVCFSGWSLDDIADGGSKPFAIRGGIIPAGAMRTFRKQETGLALNNKDDCVNLMDQDGVIKDQICYGTTHKNEIFTHAGGDWKPKPRTKKTTQKSSSQPRHTFGRELISYQSDLPSELYEGYIEMIDEEKKVLVLKLADERELRVSYAYSPMNVEMAALLLDVSQPVEIQAYVTGDAVNLVSMKQEAVLSASSGYSSVNLIILALITFLLPLVLYVLRRFY
jgi:endonuclease YncB( thermonuclease family)